jgi:hypothetical protein
MKNLNLAIVDELAFNPISIQDAVKKKLFQGSVHQRPWHVQQTLASEGEISWHIEVETQDGSKNLHPLADGNLPTVLAWLEQNKDLLATKN